MYADTVAIQADDLGREANVVATFATVDDRHSAGARVPECLLKLKMEVGCLSQGSAPVLGYGCLSMEHRRPCDLGSKCAPELDIVRPQLQCSVQFQAVPRFDPPGGIDLTFVHFEHS